MYNDFIHHEIGLFDEPRQSGWKQCAGAIIAIAAIGGFMYLLLWLASIGAL